MILCSAVLLYTQTWETYQTNITKESEFYDPDTVELMEWAAKQPKDTVFSVSEILFFNFHKILQGSMQLNAGVRLSSWRALTNHPHYEDKECFAFSKAYSRFQTKGRIFLGLSKSV